MGFCRVLETEESELELLSLLEFGSPSCSTSLHSRRLEADEADKKTVPHSNNGEQAAFTNRGAPA